MSRLIEVTLEKRQVSCVAELLDEEAPRTCAAIWDSLPQSGDAWHAKYSNNEVYTLVPAIKAEPIGLENPTVMPIPADLVYWDVDPGIVPAGVKREFGLGEDDRLSDLAIFYDRNNFIFNPATGPIPGNVFGRIVEGFDEMQVACNDVWRSGSVGERLTFVRGEAE